MSRSRYFHLCGNITIAGEGLQNLGLCSTHRASEQGGIFIVPHLLWHPVSSEGPPPFSCLFRHTKRCWESILTHILMGPIGHVWKGMLRTYCNPDPQEWNYMYIFKCIFCFVTEKKEEDNPRQMISQRTGAESYRPSSRYLGNSTKYF